MSILEFVGFIFLISVSIYGIKFSSKELFHTCVYRDLDKEGLLIYGAIFLFSIYIGVFGLYLSKIFS